MLTGTEFTGCVHGCGFRFRLRIGPHPSPGKRDGECLLFDAGSGYSSCANASLSGHAIPSR